MELNFELADNSVESRTDFNKPLVVRNPELYAAPVNERRAWEASFFSTTAEPAIYEDMVASSN